MNEELNVKQEIQEPEVNLELITGVGMLIATGVISYVVGNKIGFLRGKHSKDIITNVLETIEVNDKGDIISRTLKLVYKK